ncbi:lipoprotein-releasing system ATP-binding protein LolD [Spirochaetota bacterium]|nr:lipoprotein-releasing system ATP-binding protein LolD [Spirochaetota bacterium]
MTLRPPIQIEHVSKKFTLKNKVIDIVENVSVTFPQNKLIAIIGASGSGKSTFLNLLGGLDKPNSGSIFINDTDITTMNEKKLAQLRNKHIGFIFQQPQLIGELTTLENVILPAYILKTRHQQAYHHAQYLLERTRLNYRKDHLSGELSGGEMQRAVIARALINNPKIILADEPTGNLDKNNALEIFMLLKELSMQKQVTVIMVTHDLNLARKADVIYELRNHSLYTAKVISK